MTDTITAPTTTETPTINRADWLSVGEIVAQYDTTHARVYTLIKTGKIPTEYVTREKSKGRQGFRHLIARTYANVAFDRLPETASAPV